jgi:hypothetical protein
MNTRILPRSAALVSLAGLTALALTGCGTNVTISRAPIGPDKVERINVPAPADSSQVWDVQLEPAAGSVEVDASGEGVVQGNIVYNTDALEPEVIVGDASVRIRQGNPNGNLSVGPDAKNQWDIHLAQGVPMNFRLRTGATQGTYELGGLSLRNVELTMGATDTSVSFRQPNPEVIDQFSLNGGAASIIVTGLGNANITKGNIVAGAGQFRISFGGQLRQDAEIWLEGAAASVDIDSAGNPVQVVTSGRGLASIRPTAGWTQNGNTYYSPEMPGSTGPKITIRVTLALGTINLLSSQ